MGRILIVVGLIIAILPIVVAIVGAQAGTWVSGITVQNLSATDDANITITFYNQDGSVAHTLSDTISAGGQKTWYLPSHVPGLPDGFIGSAVVSSDQPVAAIVNTQVPTVGTGTEDNPNRVGTSTGVLNPGPKVYLTQIMKDYYGWNSYFAVQNAGASATTVTVHYYDATGAEVDTDTQTIQAYASYIFRQPDNPDLPSGFVGSAVIEGGGQNIAVICNFYNVCTDHTTAQFHSYNGFTSGSTKLYVPRVVKDYYNYQSGLKVQNISETASTRVKVTYYFGGNTYEQTSPSIGPGQAWGPYLGDETQVPMLAGVSGSGSAIIESLDGAPIVATVNEDNRIDPPGRGVTYNAFLDGEQTNSVFFPQVTAEYYGYSSGIQIQNVGTASADLTVTYSGQAPFTVTGIAPGASWSQFAPNAPGMTPGAGNDNYNGSVTVTSTQPIVGIANLSFRYDVDPRYGMNYGDSFTTYNGINQ
jgi:hypothetical protein